MVILASKSPRRRELLAAAGIDFIIDTEETDETLPIGTPPSDAVEMLSLRKAEAVGKKHPGEITIGSDTVVALDGEIFGKPEDDEDAYLMLRKLSGRVHSVFTGVTLYRSEDEHDTFSVETKVEFRELTDEEIREYIATGEPSDKAGAYAIQGIGGKLVKGYEGDYNNVIGLPTDRLAEELEKEKWKR